MEAWNASNGTHNVFHFAFTALAPLYTPLAFKPVCASTSAESHRVQTCRRLALFSQTRLPPPNWHRHSPCLNISPQEAFGNWPDTIVTALYELKKNKSTAKKKCPTSLVAATRVGGRLDSWSQFSPVSHIASSTSRTMLLTLIHSWSSTLRVASEVCQLLLARTIFVLHTKTS